MDKWLKDWRKIVLYALCTALIFFALYMIFAPSKDSRYVVIAWTDETKIVPVMYMDTATGKIYRARSGKLLSSPHDY